jgi:hypothetical protein
VTAAELNRNPHQKFDKGDQGFQEDGGGANPGVPLIAQVAGKKGAVKAVEKAAATNVVVPEEVRKHVVTVIDGDQTRRVTFLVNSDGNVSEEEVRQAPAAAPPAPAAANPAQPPAANPAQSPANPAQPPAAAPRTPGQAPATPAPKNG